jgi:hypothetical protein
MRSILAEVEVVFVMQGAWVEILWFIIIGFAK